MVSRTRKVREDGGRVCESRGVMEGSEGDCWGVLKHPSQKKERK